VRDELHDVGVVLDHKGAPAHSRKDTGNRARP
jgi:hypothetical protein